MKFKYMYQQLLSHIGIITVSFIIVGIIVSQFAENLVYKNKEEELISYGNEILQELKFISIYDTVTLNGYQEVLDNRNITIWQFNAQGDIRYPPDKTNVRIRFSDEEWSRIVNGRGVTVTMDDRLGNPSSIVVLPYVKGDYLYGGIILTAPISNTQAMVKEFNDYLVMTVLVTIIISFIISWFLSQIHGRRIKQLQNATSAVAQGNYDIRVQDSDFDEIGELASDFNKMVQRLKKSNEEIKILENRKRQFIADVSHEMRTPLTTISGIIEGLQNDMIPESEKEKGLQLASQETKRLIRLVNENLDYEKIRSNQVKLTLEEIELADIFEIVEEQLAIQAKNRGSQILVELEGKPIVFADYDRLIQIVLNITKNSIQFTENGNIFLRGKQTENYTIIEIEDTGVGIDPKDIENIWQRFYKADVSRRSNPFGEFGLGLSIVQQLVRLHRGEIYVESEKGKGTKFTIHLPLKIEKDSKS